MFTGKIQDRIRVSEGPQGIKADPGPNWNSAWPQEGFYKENSEYLPQINKAKCECRSIILT